MAQHLHKASMLRQRMLTHYGNRMLHDHKHHCKQMTGGLNGCLLVSSQMHDVHQHCFSLRMLLKYYVDLMEEAQVKWGCIVPLQVPPGP